MVAKIEGVSVLTRSDKVIDATLSLSPACAGDLLPRTIIFTEERPSRDISRTARRCEFRGRGAF